MVERAILFPPGEPRRSRQHKCRTAKAAGVGPHCHCSFAPPQQCNGRGRGHRSSSGRIGSRATCLSRLSAADCQRGSDSGRSHARQTRSDPMIPRHLVIAVAVLLMIVLGMAVYVWQMRGRAAAVPVATSDDRPLAPPSAGPTEQLTLFVAYDDPGILRAQSARIPLSSGRQQRAEELLRALLALYLDKSSPHAIGVGSDIRSVYLVDPGLAVIDLNAAFADTHRSGVLVEELTVASLIHTLSANIPGILKVKILVDGKERDSLAGHADLSDFYDVSAVNQLSIQLQSVP